MQNDISEIVVITIIGTFVMILLAVSIVLYYRQYTRKQKEHLIEKELLQTQFQQALLQTQIEIQEQTLKNISQEIHDNIGQILSLAKLNLNTFENGETDANKTKIESTKQLVSKAINDLRNLSRSLHGDRISELGLQESVENELSILENTEQFKTHLKATGPPFRMPAQKEMVLFRIVQEALHNAVKHSKAANIYVDIEYSPEVYKLSVRDDGRGFDAVLLEAFQKGIGLSSMKNRAALANARFSIQSSPGNGTIIFIELHNPTA